jgi:glucuronoarabinoxylan endo-1,4-beta-xylanase
MHSMVSLKFSVSLPRILRQDLLHRWLGKLPSVSLIAVIFCGIFVGCSTKLGEPYEISKQALGAAGDVTVTLTDVKQTIKGYGASSAFFAKDISDEDAEWLFNAKTGIGLSLLRTMVGMPFDIDYANEGAQPTTGASTIATLPELKTAKQAVKHGAQVWATAWSPPPIWKTSNSKNGKGATFSTNKLKPEHYQDYADYLAKFVEDMATEGVPIMAMSPINEPDYVASWDNAQFSAAELVTFIGKNLGPTFEKRVPKTKIAAPDTARWFFCKEYVTALLADATANKYVPIAATHPYPESNKPMDLTYNDPQKNGKEFWQTEWSLEGPGVNGQDTPDPGITSALTIGKMLHDHMVITGMNAWSYWSIYIDYLDDPHRMNPAFIQPDAVGGVPKRFKRGYGFGNWSKFVRPGFKRVGATEKPVTNVLVEAYKDDAGHIAIVVMNDGANAVDQKFWIEGGQFGDITPWVTSASDDLAPKAIIPATDNFSFSLPSKSIVTFVNWDAKVLTPDPLGISTPSGTGGAMGAGGITGASGGTGAAGATGAGGAPSVGGTVTSGGTTTTGGVTSSGGTTSSGDTKSSGGSTSSGSPSNGGSSDGGGSSSTTTSNNSSGCSCRLQSTSKPSGSLFLIPFLGALVALRRRRARRRS